MKRLGQISVIGIAGLAVWLALPGAEERAPVGRAPSRSDAPDAPVDAQADRPANEVGSPVPALPGGAPAVPAGASREKPGRGEARAAREKRAAARRRDERRSGVVVGAAPRRDDPAWGDPPDRSYRDTEERPEAEAREREQRTGRSQRRGASVPDPAPVDPLVGQEVSDGSGTADEFGPTGDEALDPSLEEDIILDELVRASLPEDASEEDVRRQRELAESLRSAPDEATRQYILQRAKEANDALP